MTRAESRPLHARPIPLLLVFAGGALGTACREAVALSAPSEGGIPFAIFGVNVVGAFVLGFLLVVLGRPAEDSLRQRIRIFAGAGFLGGFTTYSALATDTALLLESHPLWGLGYASASIVAGLGAAAAGMLLGARAAGGERR